MIDRRHPSLSAQLLRFGFQSATTAAERMKDARLAQLLGLHHMTGENIDPQSLEASALVRLRETADPDLALLGLLRLSEVLAPSALPALSEQLRQPTGARLLAVLGASSALTDHLVRHPDDIAVLLVEGNPLTVKPAQVRQEILAAVGAKSEDHTPIATLEGVVSAAELLEITRDEPEREAERATLDRLTALLRQAYRRRILAIAGIDLASQNPTEIVGEVAANLADAAGAALEAALAVARSACIKDHPGVQTLPLAIIAMGKCGARELNYVSDVDVIFVVEPGTNHTEDEAVEIGTRLASMTMRCCAAPGPEPALWQVDAALRPEGKNGPLVRTLESHVNYYKSWAKTWEFQALLKARPIAGDNDLGAAYLSALNPMVWTAVERENFVADSQAMRRRVEGLIPPAETERQLKLGTGGLRDVEFTVQLLQLVHGRADQSLHVQATLDAVDALAKGGYIGRAAAERLTECYRFLRVIEHRIQVHQMRRTHLLPTADGELLRIARAAGLRGDDSRALGTVCRSVRSSVRRLHEELYYRPLLPATAQLTVDEVQLAPEAADRRLNALGYRNPAGARRHLEVLSVGLTRRAAIQRQLLPVMLGWFAEGADPDGALLAFRRLSEDLGRTHWYLKMLRDSANAAHRLAEALSASRYIADVLDRTREAVAWFGDDTQLAPRPEPILSSELDAAIARSDTAQGSSTAIRALRRREMLRIAMAEVTGQVDLDGVLPALTAVDDVVLRAGASVAAKAVRLELGAQTLPTQLIILAMGRLGGREVGYASDADIIFLHEPRSGTDPEYADQVALRLVTEMRSLLEDPGLEPGLELDLGLRPEGRNGPVVRTVASYREYLGRWAQPWEYQALLRARVLFGEPEIAADLTTLIDSFRYPAGGVDAGSLREIRRIKARIDSERLPRGADPLRHLKLGRGGLTDIEWTVQLCQLRHGFEVPGLRVTPTLAALDAAADAGIITLADAQILTDGWRETVRLRNAIVIACGRTSPGSANQIPHDGQQLEAVARLLGYSPGSGEILLEDHLRRVRHTFEVVDRLFLE